MNDRDNVGRLRVERPGDLFGIARAAPLDLEAGDRRAVAFQDLRQAVAEVPGHHDERTRARPGHIRNGGFHA